MGRYHDADIRHFLQLFNRGRFQRIQSAEIRRQTCGSGLADFTNAQRVEEPGKRRFFRFFQRIHHVLRRFRSHPIESGQLACRQGEEICWRVDILFLNQLIDNFVAHTVNIERAAGNKVFQRLLTLCPTNQAAGTASDRFAFHTFNIRPAHRTMLWKHDFTRLFRTLGKHHVDDLRDHIARPANNNFIANTQPQTIDFIGIMQGGVTDQYPGNLNRLKTSDGRNRPGTSDLKLNIAYKGHLLLRRELKRHRPARRARDKAQLLLQRHGVDFNHHAVDIET